MRKLGARTCAQHNPHTTNNHTTNNHTPASSPPPPMPTTNNKPSDAPAHTAKRRRTDVEDAELTNAQVAMIDTMNEQFHAADTRADIAEAEVARLKLKYEPVGGVLMTKTMELAADHGTCHMVVTVRTGERLRLELVQRPLAGGGWAPNWRFMPSTSDHTMDLGGYGTYDVCIGDGNFGQDVIVTFGRDDVRFVVNHEPIHGEGPMTIEEFTPAPGSTVTLPTHGERA
jgi:hypothetical protein